MTSPVIEAVELTKDFISHMLRRRTRVLNGVTFAVSAGETYGLLGVNGAGKTTTLKLLLGLLRPTSGEARVLGSPAGCRQGLARIGFLPEQPYFYAYLTGAEFLDFAGQVFGLPAKERQERIRRLLEMVSMTDAADVAVRRYSKGMLQRLGIAQALINNPEVVFLDEPQSGLDPIGRRDVRLIMLKLKEQGKTIFFNSHLLPDVNELCDRIGVLHRGTMVAEGTIKSIAATGRHQDLEEFFLETVMRAESTLKAGVVPAGAADTTT